MPFDTTTLEQTGEASQPLALLGDRLPGLIFQCYRSAEGAIRFPYLAGADRRVLGDARQRQRLAVDGRHAFDRVHPEDFPRLMVAVERSAKSLSLIATQVRLTRPGGSEAWFGVRAQPEPHGDGTLWHGIMVDISEQIAHQAHLRELSDTDELTGLPNRRKLMSCLDHQLSLSCRHGTPLSLILFDLDHFKRVNDTWGHLKGDEVLGRLSELCQELLRGEDMLARLGGEEFAVLLPLTPKPQALNVAQRLRERVAGHDFGLPRHRLTISLGVAEYRIGESREALIDRADCHLYVAKESGRNRAVGSAEE
ncbi:GGDEF domain-containing protein [Bisbaumannia pacifica]|uniref:diguanylate cyclase n=1 Tax=Bisbaumannia pacifica TaxID=77098 RepID=A0ABD4KXM8_9GAMM|nr:sensor domain-containing diguanylate cyclase [Halomonas pacifica]MBH8578506.1 GGDEF domain-containing protein [Halomonas pacifica]